MTEIPRSSEERLTLPEALLLLALKDATGEYERGIDDSRLHRALLAGVIIDLLLRERLLVVGPNKPALTANPLKFIFMNLGAFSTAGLITRTVPDVTGICYLKLENTDPTGHTYLDHALARLSARRERLGFIHTLPGFVVALCDLPQDVLRSRTDITLPDQRFGIAEALMARNALRLVSDKSGKAMCFPETGIVDTGEDSMRLHLSEIIALTEKAARIPDERTRCLLALVRATGLMEIVFGREHQAVADWRIAQMFPPESKADTALAAADRYIRSGAAFIDLVTLL